MLYKEVKNFTQQNILMREEYYLPKNLVERRFDPKGGASRLREKPRGREEREGWKERRLAVSWENQEWEEKGHKAVMEFERIKKKRKWNLFIVLETTKVTPGIIFNYFWLLDFFWICNSLEPGWCMFSGYHRVTAVTHTTTIHIYLPMLW